MDQAKEEHKYWVGFNLVKGIGAVRFQALLDHFGSLERAWQAPEAGFLEAGLSPRQVERIRQIRTDVDLDLYINQLAAKGIAIVTWLDGNYPPRLKTIDQPPPVLYARGSLCQQDESAVAIVGTRRVSAFCRQVCEEIASHLAANGVTIVSGLARGVDAIAHEEALKAGGRTVAVLGSGVDCIYPPEHSRLAEAICAHGALLSDYAPGTPPDAASFPPRKRIISGMSMAIVVVEAGETSGALISAQFPVDQGREVFAAPGKIYASQSKGTNRLIASGARRFLSARDLLDLLDLARVSEQHAARQVLPANAVEAKLSGILTSEPIHLDEIRSLSGLPIERVSATLVMMELKGLVRQVGGMNYIAVREEQAIYE